MNSGAPWMLTNLESTSTTRLNRIKPATSMAWHSQVYSSMMRQSFDLLALSGGVEDEVVGTDCVGLEGW